MIVTIANAKGGKAATTSSVYFAYAARLSDPDLKVTVLDTDPQSSATQWAMETEDNGEPLDFEVKPANRALLDRLATKHSSDLVIVDTPPAGAVLDTACRVADFVVIPSRPTPLDLQQTYRWEACVEKPHAVLLVAADTRTLAFRESVESLDKERIPRFDTIIRSRQDIIWGFMHRPNKLWEYADAWQELKAALPWR